MVRCQASSPPVKISHLNVFDIFYGFFGPYWLSRILPMPATGLCLYLYSDDPQVSTRCGEPRELTMRWTTVQNMNLFLQRDIISTAGAAQQCV